VHETVMACLDVHAGRKFGDASVAEEQDDWLGGR
jgi:hypothetical protein